MGRCAILIASVAVAACGGGGSGQHVIDVLGTGDDAPACVANAACTTNPNPCVAGTQTCSGGAPACVDGTDPTPDGTTCGSGACTLGACLAPVEITQNTDLSTTAVTAGRACAEAPSYAVTAVAQQSAALSTAPAGCVLAGDEVLLINSQGSGSQTTNVGSWELLQIASASGNVLTFTTPVLNQYGHGATGQMGIGADQQVQLVRVPHLGPLTVDAGVTVTVGAWAGASGGVLALRAASVTLNGVLDASGLGYRPGRWSIDGPCSSSVTTETGESISGPAVAQTAANSGGPGGLGAAAGASFNGNTPLNSTAAHAIAGQLGTNGGSRTVGPPGAAYGIGNSTKLTFGSGSSGNLSCIGDGSSARLLAGGVPGGGIVVVLGGDVAINNGGGIRANAGGDSRDVSASGGYVFIRGANVSLGTAGASALGSTAHNDFTNTSLTASPGYIAITATAITGTSAPAFAMVP